MQRIISHTPFGRRQIQRNRHHAHRPWLVGALWLIPLAALLAGSALLYTRVYTRVETGAPSSRLTAHSAAVVPADLFIESVVKGDGSLGWHQLCPSIQAQLPLAELTRQADTLRNDAKHYGVTFSSNFIGEQPQSAGEHLRMYVVTAHWPNGATQARTYSVLTQASGCVADVQTQ